MRALYRLLFRAACAVGRPVGGIRPRRVYHWLAERGFDRDRIELEWRRDRFGNELLLSPYYFIDRHILAFGCYDRELHDWVQARVAPGMVCFDVGANIGEVALQMARLVGPAGRVYAFEPVPHLCDRLRANVQRNGFSATVVVRSEALSDREGPALIRAASAGAANQGRASLVDDENAYLTESLPISTTTLDRFVGDLDLPRLDLVKVDIQGSEPRMLRGAERTLDRYAPDVLMEVAPWELRFEGMSGEDLLARMEGLGYRAFAIERGRAERRLDPRELARDPRARNVLFRRQSAA
jgi:FkbM family methyltransferase